MPCLSAPVIRSHLLGKFQAARDVTNVRDRPYIQPHTKGPTPCRAFQGVLQHNYMKSDEEMLVKFLSVICVPSDSLMTVEPALKVAEEMSVSE